MTTLSSTERGEHTPGPWDHWSTEKAHGGAWHEIVGDRKVLAVVFEDHDDESLPAHANARLIAAAPDLLAALVEIADDNRKADDPFWWTMARNAIAKAVQS